MKLLFDLLPVILFFVAYKLGGSYPHEAGQLAATWLGGLIASGKVSESQAPILLATAVAIVASRHASGISVSGTGTCLLPAGSMTS